MPSLAVRFAGQVAASAGAGEAGQGPTAATVANALADALGLRLRDMPLSPEPVRAAMST